MQDKEDDGNYCDLDGVMPDNLHPEDRGDDEAVVKGNFAYAASKNAVIIITACRTRGESINEVYTQEKNLNIKVEWFRKSYQYHMCQDTLELCNQEFARMMFDVLSK